MNIIPKEDVLEDGISFSFHGGDCYFEFENRTVDVEFGLNDRVDGFDAYRLYDFLITSQKDKYKYVSSSKEFKKHY